MIERRVVPSTMVSVRTVPRRRERVEWSGPRPVREEWRVRWRWCSTRRVGRVRREERMEVWRVVIIIPPAIGLAI